MAGSLDNICGIRVILWESLCIDFPLTNYYVRKRLCLSENIGQTSSLRSIQLFAPRTSSQPVSHRSHPSGPPIVQDMLYNRVLYLPRMRWFL